jgi:hypothetical protein
MPKKVKNKKRYRPKSIEKPHPPPKEKPYDELKPPNINGEGRFHTLPYNIVS